MDVLNVKPMKTQKQFKRARRNKGVKVVYISSPMMVKTCASRFRDLVQELTGRDSDAERFMESINAKSPGRDVEDQERLALKKGLNDEDSLDNGYGYGGLGFGFSDLFAGSLEEFGNGSMIFS